MDAANFKCRHLFAFHGEKDDTKRLFFYGKMPVHLRMCNFCCIFVGDLCTYDYQR